MSLTIIKKRQSVMASTLRRSFFIQEKGFTLIEVMLAIVFFSIVMLAIGRLQINSVNSTTHAKHVTEATSILISDAEMLKGLPIDMLPGDQELSRRDKFWYERSVLANVPENPNSVAIRISIYSDSRKTARLADISFIKSNSINKTNL